MKEKKKEEFWKRACDTHSLIPESCILLQDKTLWPRSVLYNYFDSSAKHFITKLDAIQRTGRIGRIDRISTELIKTMATLPFKYCDIFIVLLTTH